MFQRFHEMRERREGGFTLIELLVVILIIAILAAIAIPVFLRQRERGWVSQMESSLKNAATAQESFATANDGDYTLSNAELEAEGWTPTSSVTLTVQSADATTGYCMEAVHVNHPDTYFYSSTTGVPAEGTCT